MLQLDVIALVYFFRNWLKLQLNVIRHQLGLNDFAAVVSRPLIRLELTMTLATFEIKPVNKESKKF